MDIIIVVDNRDRAYDSFMKHKMCGLEWLMNKKLNQNKTVIIKFSPKWRHTINRKNNRFREG